MCTTCAVHVVVQNVNHLQALHMHQITTVRFDSKVLRPPRIFIFRPPSVLTSSLVGFVQKLGEVKSCKPSLAPVSCHEVTLSNAEEVDFTIGAKVTLPRGQVIFSSGNPKVDEEQEKPWPV